MSYGIPFDFNMPQFVNTRASQRVVVSIHAGGLRVFGGEGARRSFLSAASVPGTASRSSAAGAPGTCSDGCLGAPVSGGAPCALRVWAAWRTPGRALASSTCSPDAFSSLPPSGVPLHGAASLPLPGARAPHSARGEGVFRSPLFVPPGQLRTPGWCWCHTKTQH